MLLAALLAVIHVALAADVDPAARAKAIVAQLTLEEKVQLLGGVAGNFSGNLPPIARLGVPALTMNDGPQGFRAATAGTSTAFPCALAVAAGWDAGNAVAFGAAMGVEFAAKGCGMMLGPALNVARLPTCGRNFEYLSGEDGALGAVMAAAVVSGVQSKGVIANAKHYVNNNQEYARSSVDAVVDERTHVEIYLPPFEAAVDAGVGSVMCSYNRLTVLRGNTTAPAATYACEDRFTITDELKGRLGFDGFVVSDWGATHSTVASALAGLDMEMGSAKFYGAALVAAVKAGQVDEKAVDEKAERVLRTMIRVGPFDSPPAGNSAANVTSAAHRVLARSLAAAGTVLLKNDKVAGAAVLPLRQGGAPYSICVAGAAADSVGALSGGGSGHVAASHSTTYLEGARARAAAAGATVNVPSDSSIEAAQACAVASDVALVFVGTWSHESQDRDTLALNQFDQSMCAYILKKNAHTVVVMTSPGALIVPWLSGGYLAASPPAALITFMPGQEAGNAIADVLWGDANPSARLPATLPNVDNEVGFTEAMYPGVGPDADHLRANYSDRLAVGYRWCT